VARKAEKLGGRGGGSEGDDGSEGMQGDGQVCSALGQWACWRREERALGGLICTVVVGFG
jgi:hypothetical protein